MYTPTEEQIASAENFIDSLPDSIVKGQYESWLIPVKYTVRITSEQLEKFVSLANALTKEFQNYPQYFAQCVKNGLNPDEDETGTDSEKTKTKKAAKVTPKKAVKTDTQAKEEDAIIKRNKQVDEKPEKQKPTTVIIQKK